MEPIWQVVLIALIVWPLEALFYFGLMYWSEH